jgi:hypothetical protein
MGGACGYAFPMMTGAEVRRTAIPRTLTPARIVGEAVLSARARHRDAAEFLAVCGGQRLFAGKVINVERRLVGGLARGKLRAGTGNRPSLASRADRAKIPNRGPANGLTYRMWSAAERRAHGET